MFFFLVTLLFGYALAQDANCDFRQNVQQSVRYSIFSPNYAGLYNPGVTCRWLASCQSGTQCRLDCTLELPLTSGCTGDRLLISRTGDVQLNNAESYCGRQTLTGILSVNQDISVGLIVPNNSPRGRFICNLTSQAIPPSQSCVCGFRKQNRIVGGSPTGVNEYTMTAGIIERSVQSILCGATIITSDYILTAAHCLLGQTPGSIVISIGNRDLFAGTRYNATAFRIHPNFNSDTYDFDIAVVLVTPRIQFSDTVTPACMPFKYQNTNLVGANVTLTGWGTTSFGGPTSRNLLQTNVRVVGQQECQRSNPNVNIRQICTLTPGRDACQFDSGGPGFYTDPSTGRLFVLGLVSYGNGCGTTNSPGVNTRVTEFLNWVVNNAPGTYCSVP